jgi:hypothetical protein
MEQLRMKQIAIAQFKTPKGVETYSTLALGEDGVVYRYDPGCCGWIAMEMAACPPGKEHRR